MDLKKSALALIALGLSGVASAGGFMPAPACTNHPVTVPCERSAWDVGFTAYWIRPTSDIALYNYENDLSYFDDQSFYTHEANSGYKFGFGLEASYHWGTGNDLSVSWTRFHKDYDPWWENQDDSVQDNNFDARFDQVNVELGQRIDVGPNWDLRAHMGLAWVRINSDFTETYASSQSNFNAGTITVYDLGSKVDGVGPRAGFDLGYRLSNGFSIVGHSAVGLYTGNRSTTISEMAYTANVPSGGSNEQFTTGDRHSVVLGAEGKVGLAYTSNMSQGTASLEAGYSVATYHNGIDLFGFFSQPYNQDGAYVTAKWVS